MPLVNSNWNKIHSLATFCLILNEKWLRVCSIKNVKREKKKKNLIKVTTTTHVHRETNAETKFIAAHLKIFLNESIKEREYEKKKNRWKLSRIETLIFFFYFFWSLLFLVFFFIDVYSHFSTEIFLFNSAN